MVEALAAVDLPAGPPRVRSVKACLLCALSLLASFAISAFQPDASLHAKEVFDHRGNASAERQSGVTNKSAIGYSLLGLSGVVAFALAPRRQGADPCVLAGVAFYVLLCFSSVVWSIEPGLTIRKLGVATFGFVAAIGYARLLGLRGVALMGGITTAAGVLLGLAAELRNGTFRPWESGYAFLGMLDKNGQALWISFFILPVLILWSRGKRWGLAWGAIGFALALLVLTNSRTALVSCLAAAMTGVFLRSSGWAKALLGSAATLFAGGLMLLVGTVGGDGVAKIAALGRTEHLTKLTGRVPLWQYIIGDVGNHPLLGHGYNAYWNPKKIEEVSSTFFWQAHQAHSIYVDLLLALGVVGLVAFVGMLVVTLVAALGKHKRTGDPAYLFVMSVVVLALVNGFAESKFLGFGLSGVMLFACVFGVAFDARTPPASTRGSLRGVVPGLFGSVATGEGSAVLGGRA